MGPLDRQSHPILLRGLSEACTENADVYVFGTPSEPDTNSMLRLLGPWLFDATWSCTCDSMSCALNL